VHPAIRFVMRACLWAAVLTVVAQFCYLLPWALNPGGLCDFPQECLAQSYPRAFDVSHALAWMFTGAGLLATATSLIARSPWGSSARLWTAMAVGLAGFAVSPFARIDDPSAWTDAHAPLDLGGAWPAEALFMTALVLYGWDVVRRLHALEAAQESPATTLSAAR
jgi:hypothetical protein